MHERNAPDRVIVITVIEPELRPLVDVAGDSVFTRIHAKSVSDAAYSVRQNHVQAVLVSPSIMNRHSVAEVAELLRRAPGVVPIALLGSNRERSDNGLLLLGACGVRSVVNLGEREGWNRLRSLVEETGGGMGSEIVAALLDPLPNARPEIGQFFGHLARLAPRVATVQELSARLGRHPGTLLSRFFRAGLPSVKSYLAMTRLVYAASFLETSHASLADVADRLHYSSPQSFGRHVQVTLGLTASEYRKDYPAQRALEHFVDRLIVPFVDVLRVFAPLGHRPLSGRRCTRRTDLIVHSQ